MSKPRHSFRARSVRTDNPWVVPTIVLLVFYFFLSPFSAQEDKSLYLSGYVKQLQSGYFFNDAYPNLTTGQLVDTFLQDHFFHHRLNMDWQLAEGWNLKGGLRTRFFYGEFVRITPNYAQQIDAGSNDWVDLSAIWLDENSFVGHSVLDRFYGEYSKDKWEIRIGRQRVNWGISTIWNPNDIFNAFAFTDFDYEERPGSDAVRARYYQNYASSLELAIRGAPSLEQSVIAGRWIFNQGSYDIQLIGGYAQADWVLGGGWAGNLKNAGFKGEASWFLSPEDDKQFFALTANVDYAFEKGIYLNVGGLYNSEGSTRDGALDLFAFELSARNLYPYRWATFVQLNYPLTPLLSTGLSTIYSPVRSHPLFLNPTVTLSIANNWSLDLVGQIVFNQENEQYSTPLQVAFLRVKYAY